ncbi:MAG TPA: pyridoxamine 5'-phosphate oxidase family protein [Candidatus Binataceae bacterium]
MKQRDAIKMTDEEAVAFLHEGMREMWPMFLATNGPGGFPHIVSMGWVYMNGRICFQTYSKSQKVLNLRRDAKAAVILEASPYGEAGGFEHRRLRGLMIRGICELDENPDHVIEILTAMWQNGADRNLRLGAKPQNDLLQFVKQRAKKRIAISFEPRKWASWDHGKLMAGTY